MLDPSNNLYIKNKDGEVLSLDEFRNILVEGGELFPNDDAANRYGKLNFDGWYRDYMAKNLIRLERGTVERYGCDESDGRIILIPEKYMQNEAKKFDKNYQKYFISSKQDFWN